MDIFPQQSIQSKITESIFVVTYNVELPFIDTTFNSCLTDYILHKHIVILLLL